LVCIMMLIFGWISSSSSSSSTSNNRVILQVLNCFRNYKNRFKTLSTQRLVIIVSEFEEELQTFLFNSNFISRCLSQSTDAGSYEIGSRMTKGTLCRSTVSLV
jgi:hypothetical protein